MQKIQKHFHTSQNEHEKTQKHKYTSRIQSMTYEPRIANVAKYTGNTQHIGYGVTHET